MGNHLALGIFAFLVVFATLVHHLSGGKSGGKASSRGDLAAIKQKRATSFLSLVAAPFLIGVFFFSYGVSVWDAPFEKIQPMVKNREFLKHSLSYLEFLGETRPDSTPLAWQEIRLPWPGKDSAVPSPFSRNSNILPPKSSPPEVKIFSSFS